MLKIGHLEPNFELKSQKITNICPKSSKISPKWGYFCRAHIMNLKNNLPHLPENKPQIADLRLKMSNFENYLPQIMII